MTDPDLPASEDTGIREVPRPPGFARLLRANLPGPLALLGYAVIAAVFHLAVHLSVPAALSLTAGAAVLATTVDVAVDYLHARLRRGPAGPGERDDGPVSGDG